MSGNYYSSYGYGGYNYNNNYGDVTWSGWAYETSADGTVTLVSVSNCDFGCAIGQGSG